MSFSVGNIVELVLHGAWDGVVGTRNIFHYAVTAANSVTPDSTFDQLKETAEAFWGQIKGSLRPITVDNMLYTQIVARMLTGTDAGFQNLALIPSDEQAGTDTGDPLPPFIAAGYRLQGSGGAQRNGYKRFAGISEGNVTNGRPAAGFLSYFEAVATDLSEDFTVFGGVGGIVNQATMRPIIVKKMANGEDPSDITVINSWYPVGVTFYGITSQNTRKIGRGI